MSNPSIAQTVNRHCLCRTLDQNSLKDQLAKDLDFESLFLNRPNLFSQTAIYISNQDLTLMREIIESTEVVIGSEAFRGPVLSRSPRMTSFDSSTHGACMGYDFHLTEQGPKLIEINTNAGGALLNLVLAKAQVACCEGVKTVVTLDLVEEDLLNMFLNEWKLQRGELPLERIAIIDEDPEKQYLFPEFQLFAKLFKKANIDCLILDPSEVTLKDSGLWARELKIDLVYNRSTDFYFVKDCYRQLAQAYVEGKVVVTPNPRHHALYANKFNLEILSNREKLEALGIQETHVSRLVSGVPKTVRVSSENTVELWSKRKNYFFKPASGFGSKAAYRGDKLTLKVWDEINHSEYVAQEIAQPGLRVVQVGEEQSELKLDLRVYTYEGKIQLLASRLYSGQTTNFRTQGGGFAPVFIL